MFAKKSVFAAIFFTTLLGNNAYAMRSITDLGDVAMFLINGWAIGMTAAEDKWDGTWQYLESMLGAQLTTEIIKTRIIHETRPNKLNDESFPSGHATGAFSAAMFIHRRYGWQQAIVPYGLALFTGYSRVYGKRHYAHDILGGAVVSALFTWMFVEPRDSNVRVWPSFSSNSAELRFSTQF